MDARTRLPRPTDRLPLGQSGLRVSPFCLGATRPEMVAEAYARGINFFFLTADMHWPLYDGLREGLARLLAARPSVRDQIVVAGVSYVAQPEFTVMPFLEILDAVPGLGRLDVLVMGGVYAQDYPARREVYGRNLAEGPMGARALGATFHDRKAAVQPVNTGQLDLAFVRYNALHPGAVEDTFQQLTAPRQTLVYNFKSMNGWVPPARFQALGLEADVWQPAPEDHYRYALSRPELDGVLLALRSSSELDALEQALERGPLDADEQDHCTELAALDLSARQAASG